MRLFVAIELEERARAELVKEQSRLASACGARGPRLVPPSHLHLTLVFVGEVDRARAAALTAAMAFDIDQTPYVIGFGGPGVFPSYGPPRILWIGLREGERETQALQAAVVERLQPLGVAPDPRPFHPHLTLARWPRGGRGGGVSVDRVPERIVHSKVAEVRLFESQLSAAGPTYTALATAHLRCSTASSLPT